MASNFEYRVHRITNVRTRNNIVEYKVKWQHTWENSSILKDNRHAIKQILDTRTTKTNIIELKVDWKQTWMLSEELNCPQEIVNFYQKRGTSSIPISPQDSTRIFTPSKPITTIQSTTSFRNPPTNLSVNNDIKIIDAAKTKGKIYYVIQRNNTQNSLESDFATKLHPLAIIKYWEQLFSCLLQINNHRNN